MESWAIVPRKFTPCSSISLTISLRPPSPMATPSSRYFQIPFAAKPYLLRLYSANSSHTSRPESSDFDSSSLENPGSNEKSEKSQAVSSNEILTRLKRYGVSGVLAYGLLNTAYYLTTFLVVWLYVAPAPGRMGYSAAVERFLKVMAMVWAGSQVTKLKRAGG
ncbi:hypothetical protein ACS0TY_006601 [Phlomoides rotata]